MKKLNFAALFLLALSYTATLRAQEVTGNRLMVALSKPGQPYRLEVNITHGAITVSGYDGSEVLIEISGGENKAEEKGNGMHRVGAGNGMVIVAEENNNQISIHSTQPGKLTNLDIKIPKGLAGLRLSAVNQGNITVNGVSGEMEVNHKNGNIRLINVSGSVVAGTVNGDITATFKAADPSAPMAFSTLMGNIDISFPARLKANARLKSDHGEITTEFELAAVSGKVTTRAAGTGPAQIIADGWIYGKIGGGGAEIQVSNSRGKIMIRKAQ
jgi:hypothetical protein